MASSERFHNGAWTFDFFFVEGEDPATFCGVADVSHGREHRCKLVLSKPATTREAGIAALKAQCLTWVEGQEGP